MALRGDTALIGARNDDDAGHASGSAYIFVRSGGAWSEQQKLMAGDAAADDGFGGAVALRGDTALIGAPGDDDRGDESGAAYEFVRFGGTWTERQKLTAGDGAAGDDFGGAVALDVATALVGAQGRAFGAAYVFTLDGSTWIEQATLTGDAASNHSFGRAVAIDGDTALVGGSYQEPAMDDEAGAVWAFVGAGSSWAEQGRLADPGAGLGYQFGWSVALSGDTALVGSPFDIDVGNAPGNAYVFGRSGGVWSEQQQLAGGSNGDFGWSVAPGSDIAIVGDFRDDAVGTDSGSAYAFDLLAAPSGATTVEVRIAASSDDAEERASGAVSRSSSDLELVFDAGGDQIVGLRFNGLVVPSGATISKAYVQFHVDEVSTGTTDLSIRAEATDDPLAFAGTSFNVSSRPTGSAQVLWSPLDWTVVGEADLAQRTPDLAAILQEVVNRPGWASGNAVVLIITGTGERTAEAWNGNAAAAPLLHIEY